MDVKVENDVASRSEQPARSNLVSVMPSSQRRFDNVHARDSELTKRLCYECGDIVMGGEEKYQDHTLYHEAAYVTYQVCHAERRRGPPTAKSPSPKSPPLKPSAPKSSHHPNPPSSSPHPSYPTSIASPNTASSAAETLTMHRPVTPEIKEEMVACEKTGDVQQPSLPFRLSTPKLENDAPLISDMSGSLPLSAGGEVPHECVENKD